MLIELVSLGITAAGVTRKYWFGIDVFNGVGQFRSNFHVVGNVPREPFFARIDMPVYAL